MLVRFCNPFLRDLKAENGLVLRLILPTSTPLGRLGTERGEGLNPPPLPVSIGIGPERSMGQRSFIIAMVIRSALRISSNYEVISKIEYLAVDK